MPSLPVVYDGIRQPSVDLVHISKLPTIGLEQQETDESSSWLREPLSHHFPAVRMMEFKYDIVKASATASWKPLIDQAQDLIFMLVDHRKQPDQKKRPIVFICHGFGGLLLKHALVLSQRRVDFQDIFDSISGILFLACIHDERKLDFKQCFLWCATVELGLTKARKHGLLTTLESPTEWALVKQIMDHFRMILLPFPVRTFYEAKATVYQSRQFHSDKSQILCPSEEAALNSLKHKVDTVDMNHLKLGSFPNRSDPFFETLLAELREIIDPPAQVDNNAIVPALTTNSTSSLVEITTSLPGLQIHQPSVLMDARLPCRILTPHQENLKFVGRQKVLGDIEATLRPESRTRTEKCVYVICGLGGMGKTQIALKYAFTSLSKFEAILWIPAENREKILARYTYFAFQLGLIKGTNEDQNKAKELVITWLQNTKVPYLLVFDNADSPDNIMLLSDFWPPSGIGSILITSRDRTLLGQFPGQDLTQMSTQDAKDLLIALYTRGKKDPSIAHRPKEVEAATNLVEIVGCLPLAITQLASIAIEDRCSLVDLEASYDNLSHIIEDSHYGSTMSDLLSQYPHSIGTVLDMNYDRLDQDQQELLNTLSFLDADKIRMDLVTNRIGDAAQPQKVFHTMLRLRRARGFLQRSSLLYENGDLALNWMHRLVQSTCQIRLMKTLDSRQVAFESAFNMVHKAFPVPPITGRHDRNYWDAQEACLAHVQRLASCVESSKTNTLLVVEPAKFSKLLHDAAWYLYERGTFQPAYNLLDIAEDVALRATDRPRMYPILGEICRARASIQTDTNQPQEAYTNFKQELDYVEAAFDAGVMSRPHMQEVFTLGGVANALQGLHRYSEAEDYYRKAIQAFEGMPGILSKMSILEHNFAICLWIQGKPEEALQILDRIIVDRNDTSTQRTAHGMFALGNVQTTQGLRLLSEQQFDAGRLKLDEALETHTQTLKLFRATVGDTHHKTGNALYKIGCHLYRKHDYNGALMNLKDALTIFKSSDAFLNETARTKYMMGCVCQDMGEIGTGRDFIADAENIRRGIIGEANWSLAQGVEEFDNLINCWSR